LRPFAWSLSNVLADFFQSSIDSFNGWINVSTNAFVKNFNFCSIDLWRKIKRVKAVPISLVAPLVFVAKSAIRWNASRKWLNVMIVDLFFCLKKNEILHWHLSKLKKKEKELNRISL
jgi:hypothetical protein